MTPNSQSLISIIVPVYNVESKYFIKCLDSILQQSYTNLEILLIDDGSTAVDTVKILAEYQAKDNRIFVFHKMNEGVVKARQCGVDMAGGEYIFFIDCDDYISRNTIESFYTKIIDATKSLRNFTSSGGGRPGDVDIVIGDFYYDFSNGTKILYKNEILEGENGFLKSLLLNKCNGTLWPRLYKTSVLKNNILTQHYYKSNDNDNLVSFLLAKNVSSEKIVSLNNSFYFWVQRETSQSKHKKDALRANWFFLHEKISEFVKLNFDSKKIENEVAFYNLNFWSSTISYFGKPKNEILRNEIYAIYWKNKWAKKQLKVSQRILIIVDKYLLLSALYQFYYFYLKPLLITYLTKSYKKIA